MNNQEDIANTLHKWFNSRQDLVIAYTNLCNLNDINSKDAKDDINTMFQLLIDYVAIGQLKVFDNIVKKSKNNNDHSKKLTHSILNKLLQTTLAVTELNEKYINNDDYSSIKKDLSTLGMIIYQRMDLEDKFIKIHLGKENLIKNTLISQEMYLKRREA